MPPSQCWSWPSTGMLICTRCLPGKESSLPHIARLIDEYLVESLDERELRAACEFGAAPSDLEFLLLRTVPDWKKVVESATRGGHLHVFRWMAERQDSRGPWEVDFYSAIDEAARYGHLELVKWLHERSFSCIDGRAFIDAATYGHLAVLKWLHEHPTYNVTHGVDEGMRYAAGRGHFATVQWIYEKFKATVNMEPAMASAAWNGDLDMLQWLYQQKRCSETFSAQVMDSAVCGGHLHVVEWLFENGSEGCSRVAAYQAAKTGNLPMLQWLHQHYSDRFDSDLLDIAAAEGHLEVLKWLLEHQSEGCTLYAMDEAAKNGHLDVVRWLHANRPELQTAYAMDGAARSGHLDMVKWLHENRSEGCTERATYEAARNGHLDMLRWLVEHFPDRCRDDLIEVAAWEGHMDVVRYLDENTNQRASAWGLGAALKQGSLKTLQVLMQNSDRDGRTLDELRLPVVGEAFDKILAQLSYHRSRLAPSLWGEALEALEFFHTSGFYSNVSLMLEQALTRGYPTLVQQFTGSRNANEKRKYVEVADNHGDTVLLRWLLANDAPVDTSSAVQLATAYVEITGYLSEGDRVQLVRESVTEKWGARLLLWMLENTSFNDDSSRIAIGNAIKLAPSDTVQWLRENLTNAEARKWCFSSRKRQRVR